MSIASAIQTKQQQVAAAYTAASGKGATMPATENLTNLATCIGSIPSGGTSPTGLKVNVTFQNDAYWGNIHYIEIKGRSYSIRISETEAPFLPIILSVSSDSTIYYHVELDQGQEEVNVLPDADGSITLQGSYAELNFVVSLS